MKKFLFLVLFFIGSVSCSWALDDMILLRPVADKAGVLSESQVNQLESKLIQFEKDTTNQIGIIVLQSLDGKPIEEFALVTARNSGIGQKDKNNGILIVLSIKDRKSRIEVGKGLESSYPDIYAKRILDDVKPFFRSGNFYGGLDKIVDDIILKTSITTQAVSPVQDISNNPATEHIFSIKPMTILIMVVVFFASLLFIGFFIRRKMLKDEEEKNIYYLSSISSKNTRNYTRSNPVRDNYIVPIVVPIPSRSSSDDDSSSRSSSDDDDSSSFGGFGGGDFGGGGSSNDW